MRRTKRTLSAMVRRWQADADWLRLTFGEYDGEDNEAITETMRNIDSAAAWGHTAVTMSDDAWSDRALSSSNPQEPK